MARRSTAARVYESVLGMVGEAGTARITMEGIAARAHVSKQTLYRTWVSPADILFDALLDRSVDADGQVGVPDSGDLATDLETLVVGTIAELTDPVADRVMRAVTAEIQADITLAVRLRDRLLEPQFDAVRSRLRRQGIESADEGVELLLGPILHRWLLRTGPFDPGWPRRHVARVLRALDHPAGCGSASTSCAR